MSQNIYIDTSI